MKISREMHAKTPDELWGQVREFRKELFKCTGMAAAESANARKKKRLRKNIARALTIIRLKEKTETIQKEVAGQKGVKVR